MPRGLRPTDRAAVRAITDALGRYSETPIIETLIEELPQLLGAEIGCVYRAGRQLRPTPGVSLEFFHSRGGPESFESAYREFSERAPAEGFANYDPWLPAAEQRNVAVRWSPLQSPDEWARLPLIRDCLRAIKIDHYEHVRLLVCDGPLLLAWVGVMGSGRYGVREKRILQSLAGPLQRRLKLEERLRLADLKSRGFDAAFEGMDAAAFIVRDDRAVVHANGAGRAMLDTGCIDVQERVRAMRSGGDPSVSVVPILTQGQSRFSLVVIAAPKARLDERLALAARRWRLTPRQQDVLRHVATGEPNKSIAERLGCSLVTIEIHVSAILRKARVEGRAALVAKFWTAS